MKSKLLLSTALVLTITACQNPQQNYSFRKAELLKTEKVFAEPVEVSALTASSKTMTLQSVSTPSSGAQQCQQKIEPLIEQSDAGTIALIAALAGAMAAVKSSTETGNQQTPVPNQIVATPGPVTNGGADTLSPGIRQQDGIAAWADDKRGTKDPVAGTDKDRLKWDTDRPDARSNANADSLRADYTAGAGSGGADRLQLQPASSSDGAGQGIAEGRNKFLAESMNTGGGGAFEPAIEASRLDGHRENFGLRAREAARALASVNGATSAAGIAPQFGPNLFNIVTLTYGSLCNRGKLARCRPV